LAPHPPLEALWEIACLHAFPHALECEADVGPEFTVIAGTANLALATAVARGLDVGVGACTIDRFPDGEVAVQLLQSVRRKEVFLVQSTAPPVNDHLIELLALADACRRAVAARITAVMPYFGYGRADKRVGRREPIMARVVADLLQAVGVDHIVTVDLHTPQIEGFFHAPVDSLTAVPTLCQAIRRQLAGDVVVVSPDVGRMRIASRYARCLGVPLIVLHKRRIGGADPEVTHVVGPVSDHACLIVDDMISTGSTIAASVSALLAAGARPEITIAATHGLFVADARNRLSHPAVQNVFVTDTVPVCGREWPKLHVITLAPLIAAALQRVLVDGLSGDLSEQDRKAESANRE
jgi:ribose-phosphate pyrophosphokinase